jgi:hypothetical protein
VALMSHDTKRLFSHFLVSLRESWQATLPQASPAKFSGASDLPRSGTFCLEMGVAPEGVAPHIFLAFQASVRPWSAGHFTVNVIVASSRDEPSRIARLPAKLEDFDQGREGRHRLGKLVHGRDKWWHLAPYQEPARAPLPGLRRPRLHKPPPWIEWVPSSHTEEVLVIAEAVDDVTADVRRVLLRAAARRS